MIGSHHSGNPFEDAVVTITASSRMGTLLRSWLAPQKFVIVLIFLMYCLGNIYIPRLLMTSNPWDEFIVFFFVGALAAEIGLLAAGTAFTRGSIVETFTVNSLLMVFLCASYIAGLQIAGVGQTKEIALFMFISSFGTFFLTTCCLLAVRWYWNIQSETKTGSITESLRSVTHQNFSIRYIMLTTAAIALAICIVRWIIPEQSQNMPIQIFQVIVLCSTAAIESILFFILCIQLALNRSRRIRIWSLTIVLAFLILFPYLNAFLVQLFTRMLVYDYLHTLMAYGYIFGLAFFSILTLSLLRRFGYHLSRRQRSV